MTKVTLKSGVRETYPGVDMIDTPDGSLHLLSKHKFLSGSRDIIAIYAPGEWIKVEFEEEIGKDENGSDDGR